jgi:hypothetical protein
MDMKTAADAAPPTWVNLPSGLKSGKSNNGTGNLKVCNVRSCASGLARSVVMACEVQSNHCSAQFPAQQTRLGVLQVYNKHTRCRER